MDPTTANTQLVLKERWTRDNGFWDLAAELYTEDCHVTVSWYKGPVAGFLEGSKKMAAIPGMQVNHVLQSPIVFLDTTGSKGTVMLGAIVSPRSTITDDAGNDILVDTNMYSDLVYTTRKVGEEWKICSFEVIYIKDTMSPVVPGQKIVIDPASLKGLRSSYQLLSWGIAKRGLPIDPNMPGPDRPETVKEVYNRALKWVGLDPN